MDLKELLREFQGNVLENIQNTSLVDEFDEWRYYTSIKLNAPIAIGWFENDDILIINIDGIFTYSHELKEISFEDYETSFQKYISADNLNYLFNDESVPVFGLRGGGGNLLTKDCKWKLELTSISWNVKVPRILNFRTGESHFLKLSQNSYEGNLYLGFSKTENYFMVMGDGGVDIFVRR